MARLALAALFVLACAVAGAAGHSCYVDYDSERDRTLVTSSGLWAGVAFDLGVTLELCSEEKRPLVTRYVTLDGADINGTVPTDGALSLSSPSGALRWNASLRRVAGSKELRFVSTLEWRDGVAPDEAAPVAIDLCPGVVAGIARECEPDPAETAMIATIVALSLATGAVVLSFAAVRKASMQHSNRRLERTNRAMQRDADMHGAHVPEREALHAADIAASVPAALSRPSGTYPGNVDAASGLQRVMHIVRDPTTRERFDVLLSHGGVKDRTLRFCVLQLLVLNDDAPAFPAGSVFVWVRKGRVGTAGKATVIRHSDPALGVFEFIGLLRQMLAEGWTVRRGHTSFPGVAAELPRRAKARAAAAEPTGAAEEMAPVVAVPAAAATVTTNAPAAATSEARADSGPLDASGPTAVFQAQDAATQDGEAPASRAATASDHPGSPVIPANLRHELEAAAADADSASAPSDVGDREDTPSAAGDETEDEPAPVPEGTAALRPFLGMSLLEHAHGGGTEKQLTVDSLWKGGPAAVAGLSIGDIVTHVDGAAVVTLAAVRQKLLEVAIVGRPLHVTFVSQETGEAAEVAIEVMTSDAAARGEPFFFDTAASEQELSPRRAAPHASP